MDGLIYSSTHARLVCFQVLPVSVCWSNRSPSQSKKQMSFSGYCGFIWATLWSSLWSLFVFFSGVGIRNFRQSCFKPGPVFRTKVKIYSQQGDADYCGSLMKLFTWLEVAGFVSVTRVYLDLFVCWMYFIQKDADVMRCSLRPSEPQRKIVKIFLFIFLDMLKMCM